MTLKIHYETLNSVFIKEFNTKATYYRHKKTGCELISLVNDDENKVFGITFRTPPPNSTGLPHIMEHSVLCGSRKYPVKEPFIELKKGSLQTFLNAFTFPDKTCYPVASQNQKDFYNLIDVYLDAVFYPHLSPETLKQEGWHYEYDPSADELSYKGIVFNEMKGAFSDPDSYMRMKSQHSLYPDTTYSQTSGGDPIFIPDLTFVEFSEFHKKYYHPSNARVFFYGDDDPEQRLEILHEYLRDFERADVNTGVALQPRFPAPKRFTFPLIVSDDNDGKKQARMTINWMVDTELDPQTMLAMQILNHILIGTPASPLRKSLIDSGLGDHLAGDGLNDHFQQMMFSTGLKGIAVEDETTIRELVFNTLSDLATHGIDPDMVQASLNTVEFLLRENNTGRFPRGLNLMLMSLRTWLYGNDPFSTLTFHDILEAIKMSCAKGERYFESLIERYFIRNPHYTTILFEPDADVNRRLIAEEKSRLSSIRENTTPQKLSIIIESESKLRLAQETHDSPEALETIPALALSNIDKKSKTIPVDTIQAGDTRILYHDLFTNGILYIDLGFNLQTLAEEELPYVRLIGKGFTELGTTSHDYVRFMQRIGKSTGGITSATIVSTKQKTREAVNYLLLKAKATLKKTTELLAILEEMLFSLQLDNKERFRQIVLEEKASLESSIIPRGHSVIYNRLRSKFNRADWVNERISGVDYLHFLSKLTVDIDHDWHSVYRILKGILEKFINQRTMIINCAIDHDNWKVFYPQLIRFLERIPSSPVNPCTWPAMKDNSNEGLIIPSQVNFVGKASNLYENGYQLHGSILAITQYLDTTWLWEKVRVQGGAYGGYCVFDHNSGLFTYLSYRDPNIADTLENYDNTARYLRGINLSEDELRKSIIGAIGRLDAYQLPDAKSLTSLTQSLNGESNEDQQRLRDQLLVTTKEDFKTFADVLDRVSEQGIIVLMGSETNIQQLDGKFPERWTEMKVL